MIKIAEVLPPEPGPLARMVRQCGVNHVVSPVRLDPIPGAAPDDQPYSLTSLQRLKAAYEEAGFSVDVIESRPPLNLAKLGLPGRDEEIGVTCELIRNMGKAGIPVWCYEWMIYGWLRTRTGIESRGGARVTGFDRELLPTLDLEDHGEVTEEHLWETLHYFLERVVPVAEEAGVKLAMHPDDPPLSPINGVGRIMRTVGNFQRLIDLVPSPVNGITMCQGNFALMTDDLPSVIRDFGRQKKVFFVHLRDVRGVPERFQETFHDNGKTDMLECMKAYRDIGFEGVLRPDHVPTMEGDRNDDPGYSSIGRLYAIGYIRGLREAVYARTAKDLRTSTN
ncbi:MAG: mannonate dehydratase [Verrucomicrobia bacterium]|nr:MAG: mannonate dehydratase [Verrucomicrobiota bacterium]